MKRLINWGNTVLEPKKKKNKSEVVSIRLIQETKEALMKYAPR